MLATVLDMYDRYRVRVMKKNRLSVKPIFALSVNHYKRFLVNKLSQAMRTRPDIDLLQDVNRFVASFGLCT